MSGAHCWQIDTLQKYDFDFMNMARTEKFENLLDPRVEMMAPPGLQI